MTLFLFSDLKINCKKSHKTTDLSLYSRTDKCGNVFWITYILVVGDYNAIKFISPFLAIITSQQINIQCSKMPIFTISLKVKL